MRAHGIRVETGLRNEKIPHEVCEYPLPNVTVLLVVGKREVLEETASVRRLGTLGSETLGSPDAVDRLVDEGEASEYGYSRCFGNANRDEPESRASQFSP